MTVQMPNGPGANGAVRESSRARNLTDYRAAQARRRDAARRLPPIQCCSCHAWFRDPASHICRWGRW
jgi:hypothetical protein